MPPTRPASSASPTTAATPTPPTRPAAPAGRPRAALPPGGPPPPLGPRPRGGGGRPRTPPPHNAHGGRLSGRRRRAPPAGRQTLNSHPDPAITGRSGRPNTGNHRALDGYLFGARDSEMGRFTSRCVISPRPERARIAVLLASSGMAGVRPCRARKDCSPPPAPPPPRPAAPPI